ncbi:hypothetical protein FF1_001780 [Malus domestica]
MMGDQLGSSCRAWNVMDPGSGCDNKNIGPGALTSGRVKWGGYRVITSSSEASKFTVDNFISGSSWLPAIIHCCL